MLIYATLTTETIMWPFSLEVIRHEFIPGVIALSHDLDRRDSKIVVDCFASTERAEVCVRLAIDRRVIPEFDAYIGAVSALNKTSLHVECATSGESLPDLSVPRKKE